VTPAIFLDRDGTLNREVDFVRRVEDLAVLPGVVDALRRLDAAGYRLIVLTNQSGIARGYLDEAGLARIHAALHERLARLPLAYLHCPHHPDGGHGYRGDCACRKPLPGLLLQARDLLGVDFAGGVLVGDSARDLLPARGLPLRTVHLRSGKPFAAERERLRAAGFTPDHEADDLAAATDWLLARRGSA
jgi:D-glycero-D-manno-heptose 1,7-bisphosphate phosphatase